MLHELWLQSGTGQRRWDCLLYTSMNPKYQKVLSDIEKAEKKKSEIEGQLKELYDKKTCLLYTSRCV